MDPKCPSPPPDATERRWIVRSYPDPCHRPDDVITRHRDVTHQDTVDALIVEVDHPRETFQLIFFQLTLQHLWLFDRGLVTRPVEIVWRISAVYNDVDGPTLPHGGRGSGRLASLGRLFHDTPDL